MRRGHFDVAHTAEPPGNLVRWRVPGTSGMHVYPSGRWRTGYFLLFGPWTSGWNWECLSWLLPTSPTWKSAPRWRDEGDRKSILEELHWARPQVPGFHKEKKSSWKMAASITGHTFLNSAFYQEGPLFLLYAFSPSPLQTSRILCLLIPWACSLERRWGHVPHGGMGCGG